VGKRNKVVLGVVGFGLMAVIVAVLFFRPRMPEYQGKTLETWIETCYAESGKIQIDSDAASAVRRIGTNAVPVLLSWLFYEPPVWNLKAVALFDRLFPNASTSNFRKWLAHERAIQRAERGKEGFYILGPKASSAIPILLEHLPKARSATVKYNIMYSLGTIQPDVKILAGRATYENAEVAEAAVEGLGMWGASEPETALPALAKALGNSPYANVRRAAAKALGNFHQPGPMAVEMLKAAAADPDGEVRAEAGRALGVVGRGTDVGAKQ
jgi:HEAT repeat protein